MIYFKTVFLSGLVLASSLNAAERHSSPLKDKSTDIEVPLKAKKKRGSCNRTMAAMLAVTAVVNLAGLASDVSTVMSVAPIINHNAYQAIDPFDLPTTTDYSCDTSIVTCSQQEDQRYIQLCESLKTAMRKRKNPKVTYQSSSIPSNCTHACDLAENSQECTLQALENGKVYLRKCDEQDEKKESSLLSSISLSFGTRVCTAILTYAALCVAYTGRGA